MIWKIAIGLFLLVVVVLAVSALAVILGKIIRGSSGVRSDNKPKSAEKPEAGAKKETASGASTQQQTGQSVSVSPKGTWTFLGSFLGIVLVGLALWAAFGLYQYFDTTPKSSVISRTVIKNNLSYGVPVEIALLKICDCESGDGTPGSAKHFNPDGSVVRNTNGTPDDPTDDDVGIAQINLKHQAKLIEELGADPEKEGDNLHVGTELYLREGPDPWNASRDCWEPQLRAYAWGGEAVVLVVRAPEDDWGDLITCPVKPGGGKVDFGGGTYWVRWNEGYQNQVEELLPREQNPSRQPDPVYNFRLKGKEPEQSVTVKFY